MSQFPISGGPLKTECEITGEHYGDVRRGRWSCCGEAEE